MGNVSREELLFTQLIVRSSLITMEQYQELLGVRAKIIEQTGEIRPLDEIIVEQGYLNEKVVDNLRRKVGYPPRVLKLPPKASASQAGGTKKNLQLPTFLATDDTGLWQSNTPSVPPAPPGYQIGEKLGEGAMGTVFKCLHTAQNREVAIKFLDPRYNEDSELLRRFMREARAAQNLQHENIVSALESGEHQGFYYLVMEYLQGRSLADVLEEDGVLPQERAVALARQIAQALQYAHEKGFIHRDIKPENIMVTSNDYAKLCDFGLTRAMESGSLMTRVGSFVGTPQYVSPEQARGVEDIDYRTDIYSLGCTLYHMVTGKLPYPHNNPVVVLTYQATRPFPNALDVVPELSPKLGALIYKMTAKDRNQRMPNATELLQAIDDLPSMTPYAWESDGSMPKLTKNSTSSRRHSTRKVVSNKRRLRESSAMSPSYRRLRENHPETPPTKRTIWPIIIVFVILAAIAIAIILAKANS